MERQKERLPRARPSRHGIIRSGTGFFRLRDPIPVTDCCNKQTNTSLSSDMSHVACDDNGQRKFNPSILSISLPFPIVHLIAYPFPTVLYRAAHSPRLKFLSPF